MTTKTRLGLSAALLSFSLALAPAAFAQDKMGHDDAMKKEGAMSKDAMSKDKTRFPFKESGTSPDTMR